jgi:hypothetical protein
MPNETLITDLVAQEAMQQLEELDRAMEGTLQQFQNCARELAQGLKIPVEVTGDVDALRTLTNTVMRDAQQATQQLTQQLQQQQQVVANTTNTISRQLMEQERLNKTQREAFTQQQQALDIADRILGSHEQNVRALARYKQQLEQLKAERKAGTITSEEYIRRELELKAAKQEIQRILVNEAKMNQSAAGSYQQLSLQLERLKMAQKQLNEEEKRGAEGKALEKEIQEQDAHLKDLAADMGEFQRNVGNYAVAANNMKGTLRQLTEEIAQLTLQYQELSDEEQRSDVGMQMRDKITQLTEEAGKYRDIVSDVKQSISASASDTRLFDSLIEAGQVFAATMGVAETACRALGMSEDNLQKSMLKVQQAMQAVQALQVIQNTLQKQSNLMKGIAILQSKAAAAAARIEAAATASATGATKAQTVAQAAFNAVAKANPYVLLATAILAVIGLVVGYTSATEDATEADEEANKQKERTIELEKKREDAMRTANDEAYRRKKVEAEMASTVANSVSKQLANYTYLQKKWKECGDDVKLQQQFLNDYKTEIDNTGFAIKNVYDAHNVLVKQAPNVINMYYALAEAAAAAAVAEEAFKRKIERQAKGSVDNGGYYYTAKRGTKFGDLSKEEQDFLKSTGGANANQNPYLSKHDGFWESYWGINDAGVEQINKFRNQKAIELRKSLDDADDAVIKYANDVQSKAEKAAKDLQGEIGTAFNTGGGGGRNGKNKGGGRGGGGSHQEQVKSEQELMDMILNVQVDAYKKRAQVAEEYTEQWKKDQLDAIDAATKKELGDGDKIIGENKKKHQKDVAELDKALKAKKISQQRYDILKAELDKAYEDRANAIHFESVEEAKKINEDYEKHQKELKQKALEALQKQHEEELSQLNNENAQYLETLRKRYLGELALAKGNEEEVERIKKDYAIQVATIQIQQAIEVTKKTIEFLELELQAEGISAESREEIAKKLAAEKMKLNKLVLDSAENALEQETEAEKKTWDQRLKDWIDHNQKYIDVATEGIGRVSELMTSIYDGQISKVQELIEEEQKRYEAEVNHIEWLADRGAITTEEAEIRKRDAAEATAKKQAALEKKKSALEYKKAIVEKANSVAQAIIATALAVTKALPNIPLSILVGALGAAQVATILAQPIKAYAEGTKGHPHPGGLAVVGDANRAELVMYGKRAWITPDSPTLVDLPKGAEVMPDASKVDLVQMGSSLFMTLPKRKGGGGPIIVNDYEALEGRVANNTKVLAQGLSRFEHSVKREMRRQKFNAYIAQRI